MSANSLDSIISSFFVCLLGLFVAAVAFGLNDATTPSVLETAWKERVTLVVATYRYIV